jgi:hypothetical protein
MPRAWGKLRMNRVQPLLDHQEVPAGAERDSLDRVRAGGERAMRDPPASRHNDREPMADVDPGARRLRTRRCRSQAACQSEGADETCRKAHAISTVDSSRHVPGIASDGRIWRTEPARKILRSDKREELTAANATRSTSPSLGPMVLSADKTLPKTRRSSLSRSVNGRRRSTSSGYPETPNLTQASACATTRRPIPSGLIPSHTPRPSWYELDAVKLVK